jgi:hypothetical protein
MYAVVLVFPLLVYMAVHVMVSLLIDLRRHHKKSQPPTEGRDNDTQPQTEGHGSHENTEQLANGSSAAA